MELFWKACCAAGPLRIDVENTASHEVVRVSLDQPFALIGRASQADVRLKHNQADRRHAFLQVIGGRVYCLDLGSATGTWWPEGARRSGWIDLGQALRIGPYLVRLEGIGGPPISGG